MSQMGTICDIFQIGKRFRVGIGNAWTTVFLAEGNEGFRRQIVVSDICGRGLRDVVILTVETAEVTACAGKRKALGAWMKMIERLLLDGVDGQGTGLGIDFAKDKSREDGSFAYRPVTFMLRVLPSISYFCKF